MISLSVRSKDPLLPHGYHISKGSFLLSTLAINILSLALPVMTLQVYDRILPNPGSGTLPVLISGVCVAIALEAVLRLTRAYIMGWGGAVYEHRMSCGAMSHLLQADLSRLGPFGIGENLHRMSAIGKLKDFYDGYAFMTMAELVFVPIFLAVIIYIAGPLAAVPAGVLMIFTLVSLAQGQHLRKALKTRDKADDERYNFLIESLEGIHTLKAFALENTFARRYEILEESSSIANYRVTESTSGTFNTGTIFSNIMVAAIIAIGALFALYGHMTTGALIATVLLSGRMMQPIQRALVLWAKYQDYTLAREKVEGIFEMPQHLNVAANDVDIAKNGTLELNNVFFRHADTDPWMLENVNLEIKANEVVLLMADHGAGKTALLEMIAGIYPPTQGTITIDGQNVLRYKPEKLIRHVGYVQTEGLIFRGTIRDNMTGFGQVDEAQAQEIAALLKLNRDIARLPAGFDTFMSSNGTDSVPPGLKQRIAMARVLATKPHLVLFDNADKALDREGYHLVYSLLARLKGKASMIIISDDQNIRSLADRVFSLEKSRLIEIDASHKSTTNLYRELSL